MPSNIKINSYSGAALLFVFFYVTQANSASIYSSCETVLSSQPSVFSQAIQKKLQKIVEEESAKQEISTVFAGLVSMSGDSVHGFTSAEKKGFDPKTSLLSIASVSKLFTSISLMQLMEKNKISPETSIMDLSNEVGFIKKLYEVESEERLQRWSKIKIKHLMSHQAGINKDLPGVEVFLNLESLDDGTFPSIDEFLKVIEAGEIEFFQDEPGQFRYSNLGMNMLARIVEGVSGATSFEAYVKQNILVPLSMNNTFYTVPEDRRKHLISTYAAKDTDPSGLNRRAKVPDAYYKGFYDGSAGISASPADMMIFSSEFFKMVMGLKNKLVNNQDLIDYFLSPVSPEPDYDKIYTGNGPMWQKITDSAGNDVLWVGHAGTGYGARTFFYAAPELGYSLVVQVNSNDGNREDIVKSIMDSVKNLFKRDVPEAMAKKLVQVEEAMANVIIHTPEEITYDPVPKNILEQYVGDYVISGKGKASISINDKGHLEFDGFGVTELLVDEHEKGRDTIIENAKKGKFRIKDVAHFLIMSEELSFEFDEKGNVISLYVANAKRYKKVN